MALKNKKQLRKITKQKLSIRQSVWPDLDQNVLWHWKKTDGWLNIPRAMPLILRIMDMVAPKGKPVSQTYLDLWCRTFDDSFVIASKPREMAFYSGFTGERAERTWGIRICLLRDLGFIDIQAGVHGPINYVLVYNPYQIIIRHHQEGNVTDAAINALKERVIEIGADEFETPIKPTKKAQGAKRRKVRPKRSSAARN